MLDKKCKELLKALYTVDFLLFEDAGKITGHDEKKSAGPIARFLISKFFVSMHSTGETTESGEEIKDGYEITIDGRAYLEDERRKFWTFVIPYSLTTFIALLSLISTIAGQWEVIRSWFLG